MSIYSELVFKIIKEQEQVIGPLALEQAKKVPGLSVDLQKGSVEFSGDKKTLVDDLVKQYEHIFGKASVELCKEAVAGILRTVPQTDIPPLLLQK